MSELWLVKNFCRLRESTINSALLMVAKANRFGRVSPRDGCGLFSKDLLSFYIEPSAFYCHSQFSRLYSFISCRMFFEIMLERFL